MHVTLFSGKPSSIEIFSKTGVWNWGYINDENGMKKNDNNVIKLTMKDFLLK